jgi:PAS domain S-box-containing protein
VIGHLLTEKRAQQQLRKSEERMRMILEHSHDGIHISRVDPEAGQSQLLLCNERFVEMTGRTREELLACESLDAFLVVENPEDVARRRALLLREGIPFTGRGSWKRPDGRENFLDWASARVIIDDEVHVIRMDRDVTGHVIAERQRQDLEAQVKHAQKLESLGVLAGGIAHDFNNLLVAILGNADLALMDITGFSPARDSVEEIRKAAMRASDLTNQMLAYSGRGNFVVEPLNLNELVEQMGHLLEVSISKKTMLRFELDRALPSFEADAAQIQQVVMNLITNAADAIGDDAGTITVRTRVRDLRQSQLANMYVNDDLPEGKYICLEVQDTGCGMSSEQLQRVFDPFYTTKFTGRGLGLAAVLGIVRGHHGAVQIDTIAGRGTTFRVLLPASDAAQAALSETDAFADAVEPWLDGGTALVVDDEPAVRRVARSMLEHLGFEVIEAADGISAQEIFRRQRDDIDVVLLDMTMPRADGRETLAALRVMDRDIPVILCSGYSEVEARATGDAAFLHKPFRMEELSRIMREVTAES